MFDYPFGPKKWSSISGNIFGPTQKAFEALDEAGQAALRADLESLWTSSNQRPTARRGLRVRFGSESD